MKINKPKIGEIFKHYKNKKEYIVVDNCKMQINDKWEYAILYKENNENKQLYVRERKEFIKKFFKSIKYELN
jgi:hypothetical protein